MSILADVRETIEQACREEGIDFATPVTVRQLSADEAIGTVVEEEYVIRHGKEVVIEATVDGLRGQAFTDEPSDWSGTLYEVFSMPLDNSRNRAVVVAALNALAGRLGLADQTIHCQGHDPMRCGPELVRRLRQRFGDTRKVLLVGLQSSILEALVEAFGVQGVRVVDLAPENIGQMKEGVRIDDGGEDISADIHWCDLMLVTGSSIVNGTLERLLEMSQDAEKPLVFFGNTIAAVAAAVELEHLCPFGGQSGAQGTGTRYVC